MNTLKLFSKFIATIAILQITLFAIVPKSADAAIIRIGNQTSVGNQEIINNDLYIVGGTVNSSGNISGDITAAGGSILISGVVGRDVNVAGGNVTILSDVSDGIRAIGGNLIITGNVAGDVVAAGGQIQISQGRIGRDVVGASGMMRIDSPVAGKVIFNGGELYINAPITGNVEATAEKITLGSGAVITGNFTYKSPQQAIMETGSRVTGPVSYTPIESQKKDVAGFLAVASIFALLMRLVSSLVIGLIFKKYTTETINVALSNPLMQLGVGLVTLVAVPVVSMILIVTILGLPLGFLALSIYTAVLILSAIIAPIVMGSWLYKYLSKQTGYEVSWKSITLGVVVYFIIGLIPIIGWIVRLGFFAIALGAIVSSRWDVLRANRTIIATPTKM